MRSRSQCRIGMAQPLLAVLVPIALFTPASAHTVPGAGNYYTAAPGRNAVDSAYGDTGGETPWQRPPSENRRGPPSYVGGPNWLSGATGVLGILPILGGGSSSPAGSSWPSWEQVPARSESPPSTPSYQPYPGSASPPTQPGRSWGDPGPSGPNWQNQRGPEPSGAATITPPGGDAGASSRPPPRTGHPPSGHPLPGTIAGAGPGGGHPTMCPPRKPPVPPPQQIADPPSNPRPNPQPAAAAIADASPAAPSVAAPPPPEPLAPARTSPANPPSPPPSPPTQAAAPQPSAEPISYVWQVGVPLSALVALALLSFPLRLLTKARRRHSRRRAAGVFLVGDRGASRMIPDQSGAQYPAIRLRLSAALPVATARWTAA
jgi:hypothetical protein